jgi:hypothetical protein
MKLAFSAAVRAADMPKEGTFSGYEGYGED